MVDTVPMVLVRLKSSPSFQAYINQVDFDPEVHEEVTPGTLSVSFKRKTQRIEPSYGAVVLTTLLYNAAATGAGSTFSLQRCHASFQAVLTGTSGNTDIAATIKVQVSNDALHWVDLGTLVLESTDWDDATEDATDSFVADIAGGAPYPYVRGYVYALSGTGAKVSLYMGQ